MFNSKRIIFLIGLLSIVALTGALMAGPAFAGKGGNGNGNGNGTSGDASHRTNICHYQEYQVEVWGVDEAGDPMLMKAEELETWMDKTVDADSTAKHYANHGVDNVNDFEILYGEGEGTGPVDEFFVDMGMDSAAECATLDGGLR